MSYSVGAENVNIVPLDSHVPAMFRQTYCSVKPLGSSLLQDAKTNEITTVNNVLFHIEMYLEIMFYSLNGFSMTPLVQYL